LPNKHDEFQTQVKANIESLGRDEDLLNLSNTWIKQASKHFYTYNFSWMGRPIIQYPQDVFAMQEIIWSVQPDLIIETGIAHGGSLVFSASMLELNAASGGPPDAQVLGIDIDIRTHNREAIDAHPMRKRISMIQGSSIEPETVAQVKAITVQKTRVLVCLDSNHTHDHVLTELEAYAPLTSIDSYCVVFDTNIEDMPADLNQDRPWGKGNNPKTAVREYLNLLKKEGRVAQDGKPLYLEIDQSIEHKLVITVAPDGFLRRIR
jgi:cephalosporin hydroxylase